MHIRTALSIALLACFVSVGVYSAPAPLPDFSTEERALQSLDRILAHVDGAIPTLTPDQVAYLKREQEFIDERQTGETVSKRKQSYYQSKEFHLRAARMDLEALQRAVKRVKASPGKLYRFAAWTDVVVGMSRVQQWESNFQWLLSYAAIDKSDLGDSEGVNWLIGPSEGEVQMLWGYWADNMWNGFVREGLMDLAYAGKNAEASN